MLFIGANVTTGCQGKALSEGETKWMPIPRRGVSCQWTILTIIVCQRLDHRSSCDALRILKRIDANDRLKSAAIKRSKQEQGEGNGRGNQLKRRCGNQGGSHSFC